MDFARYDDVDFAFAEREVCRRVVEFDLRRECLGGSFGGDAIVVLCDDVEVEFCAFAVDARRAGGKVAEAVEVVEIGVGGVGFELFFSGDGVARGFGLLGRCDVFVGDDAFDEAGGRFVGAGDGMTRVATSFVPYLTRASMPSTSVSESDAPLTMP